MHVHAGGSMCGMLAPCLVQVPYEPPAHAVHQYAMVGVDPARPGVALSLQDGVTVFSPGVSLVQTGCPEALGLFKQPAYASACLLPLGCCHWQHAVCAATGLLALAACCVCRPGLLAHRRSGAKMLTVTRESALCLYFTRIQPYFIGKYRERTHSWRPNARSHPGVGAAHGQGGSAWPQLRHGGVSGLVSGC